jgi:hypothetical protein
VLEAKGGSFGAKCTDFVRQLVAVSASAIPDNKKTTVDGLKSGGFIVFSIRLASFCFLELLCMFNSDYATGCIVSLHYTAYQSQLEVL